jgi:hypothetical protein
MQAWHKITTNITHKHEITTTLAEAERQIARNHPQDNRNIAVDTSNIQNKTIRKAMNILIQNANIWDKIKQREIRENHDNIEKQKKKDKKGDTNMVQEEEQKEEKEKKPQTTKTIPKYYPTITTSQSEESPSESESEPLQMEANITGSEDEEASESSMDESTQESSIEESAQDNEEITPKKKPTPQSHKRKRIKSNSDMSEDETISKQHKQNKTNSTDNGQLNKKEDTIYVSIKTKEQWAPAPIKIDTENATLKQLKKEINKKLKTTREYSITYRTRPITNEEKTISEMGITNGSTIKISYINI